MKLNIAKNRRLDRHGRGGFTLIELMLVLVILGILAAIVVPKFGGITANAKQKQAVTQISTFSTAIEMFEVDNGRYPKNLNELMNQPRDAQNWHQYMEQIPLDPWNNAYLFVSPGKHRPNSYDLSSIGPDGRAGTDDDVVNWQTK